MHSPGQINSLVRDRPCSREAIMTSHYSAAELSNLILAVNHVVGHGSRKSPALVMLKKRVVNASALTA
jgi:hypothetical protein